MTTAALWILIAWLLAYAVKYPPLVALLIAGKYDNRTPRDQQARMDGWKKYLFAAHYNALEGFPGFAVGMLLAAAAGTSDERLAGAGAVYAVSRIIYAACYMKTWHLARTAVWTVGFAVILWLMATAAFA